MLHYTKIKVHDTTGLAATFDGVQVCHDCHTPFDETIHLKDPDSDAAFICTTCGIAVCNYSCRDSQGKPISSTGIYCYHCETDDL